MPKRGAGVHARWLLEAAAAWSAYGVLAALPLDAASNVGGFLGRAVGPRLRASGRARRHLRRAFPGIAPGEVEATLRGMWDNLGRSLGEFAHLAELDTRGPDARIELVGAEHIERVKRDGRPAIAFTAHLGNWELAALVGALHGLPLTLVYRRANNPYVERLIQHCRRPQGGRYVAKGAAAARAIPAALRHGRHLGMIVDQKASNGVAAPFFGRAAMTTPVPALCALHYGCTLLPARVERLNGARFRVTVHPPLDVAPSGDRAADTRAITAQVNAVIEGWIRQRPEQWLWQHRRWPA